MRLRFFNLRGPDEPLMLFNNTGFNPALTNL